MNKIQVYNDLKNMVKNIYLDESMKKHTSFRIGGIADILVKPISTEEIKEVINYCKTNSVEYVVIGNGTNLLVKDGGIRQVVIKISDSYNSYKIDNNIIMASAGTSLIALSYEAYSNGLSGLEFACGIPGTVGGAIKMNAGAFKGEMSQVVEETTYMDIKGNIFKVNGIENHRFEYRSSLFNQNNELIILEAVLKLENGNKKEIKEKMEHNTLIRKTGQPINDLSAGSTFKRPEGFHPGKLIEECGLKGYTIGGAQVSNIHANFIINFNNATAKDILDLMKYVQTCVYEKFNVMLEPEIKVIGED